MAQRCHAPERQGTGRLVATDNGRSLDQSRAGTWLSATPLGAPIRSTVGIAAGAAGSLTPAHTRDTPLTTSPATGRWGRFTRAAETPVPIARRTRSQIESDRWEAAGPIRPPVRWWKLIGAAGFAGVAGTGVLYPPSRAPSTRVHHAGDPAAAARPLRPGA